SFAENIDALQEAINVMFHAVSNLEAAMGQLGYVIVNIGTAVTSIARVLNAGQQSGQNWQHGDPWYIAPRPSSEQNGDQTAQTTTAISALATGPDLGTIPE
ncbi:unnamed protein product, partial [Prorocentrum cordatum]